MELKLLTIKEYAKERGITYEAVRQQIQKYKNNELKDHIIKNGKTQYLDEYAVNYLNNKRRESPVMVVQMDKDDELESLRSENRALLLKIASLQERLLDEQDLVKQLQQEKIELLDGTSKRGFWSIFQKK